MKRHGILAAGNFIVDTVKVIDAWPEQDALCTILSQTSCNGGGPYNILKNFSKLAPEIPLEACGLIGDDAEGVWVKDDCASANIDISQLHCHQNASTSSTDAMTDSRTGRRTFFHQRGANAELDVIDIDFSQTKAKIFSLGYMMLLDKLDVLDENGITGAAKALRAARTAGLITAVDAVSTPHPQFKEVAIASLKEADIFFVNELEASWILGYEVDENNLKTSVRELASMGCRGIVVIHTAGCAVSYSTVDGQFNIHASIDLPQEKNIGATGAGDAFATGYLYAVHQEWSPEKSLQCAVCVAAMSLTNATPSDGMRDIKECLGLGEIYGYKEIPKQIENCGTGQF